MNKQKACEAGDTEQGTIPMYSKALLARIKQVFFTSNEYQTKKGTAVAAPFFN